MDTKIKQEIEQRFPSFLINVIKYNVVTIPAKQALSIYTVRARINENSKSDKVIKGYDEVVNNLELFKDSNISIHLLLDNMDRFVLLFSDISNTKVIGTIDNLILI